MHPTDDPETNQDSHSDTEDEEHDPLDDSLNANKQLFITDDIKTDTKENGLFEVDLCNDINIELPIPEPFEGYIYKRSRYIRSWRKRFCVISLKHCRLSTYPNQSKIRCTETIKLKQYDLYKVYDIKTINKLKGDLKAWDEFVLVPLDSTIDWTFLFCGSCTGCWDDTPNSKYMKNAVICAMSYREARLAINNKQWRIAKQYLLIFACNKWTMHKSKSKTLKDRFFEYEKWIKFALKLPFDMDDGQGIEQQCKLLRNYAFYMMNVYGDRYEKLEKIYKTIIEIDPNDGITLTYYGKWLLYGPYQIKKAEQCLRKAIEINNGSAVFLNHPNDQNIKSIRFGEAIYAKDVLKQCLIKQRKIVD